MARKSTRGIDLASAGLPGYCAAITVDADGTEHFALLRYNQGDCDYRPIDWAQVAPPYVQLLTAHLEAYGCLITGLEAEPERRKQQRNGDMYCSSRCRQGA